jgi:hypothetical protein
MRFRLVVNISVNRPENSLLSMSTSVFPVEVVRSLDPFDLLPLERVWPGRAIIAPLWRAFGFQFAIAQL